MAAPSRGAEAGVQHVRAFVAVKLPDEVIEFLRQVQSGLKKEGLDIKDVKWVRPENIHLTLKFLGDIKSSEIDAIGSAIKAAAAPFPPLALSASGLGAFPGVKRPRVLWSGVGGDLEALSSLHARLDEALSTVGIEKETKKFKGHLTLARIKGRVKPEIIIDAVSRYGNKASPVFTAESLYLIKSDLKPSGPLYTDLLCAPMGIE